jgi:hypothetical protein
VFRQIIGEMAAVAVAGTAAGLIAAAALTRAITAMLFGVSPADVATYVAVAMGLAVVAADRQLDLCAQGNPNRSPGGSSAGVSDTVLPDSTWCC